MQCYCCDKDGIFLRQVGNVKLPLCTKHYRVVDEVLSGGVLEIDAEMVIKTLDQIKKENAPGAATPYRGTSNNLYTK